MFAYEGVGREEEGRLYVSNSMGRECVCLQKRMMGRVRAGEEKVCTQRTMSNYGH